MQRIDGAFVFSATDLTNFLECRRLTELESLVSRALLDRPVVEDEQAELIARKGVEHELAYLAHLRESTDVREIERTPRTFEGLHAAEARTLEAMHSGAPIIYQATFFDGTFVGHADFLRRVERPSALGSWSYEVLDTKLALSTKPYFVVQLCNYSEQLARLQGVSPRHAYVVHGDGTERALYLNDFAAYYRHLKSEFLSFARASFDARAPSEYPLRRNHCRVCPWDGSCRAQRVADDHLSLVAWMRRDNIATFEAAGISTVAQLACAGETQRPFGMNPETWTKLRRQAMLQVRGRTEGLKYELIAHDVRTGFGLLPPPDEGDIFFDMEGDPLYEPGRPLEYLFGVWAPADSPEFRAFWGLTPGDEKTAFIAFVEYVLERRKRYPGMHVYHYANYEKAALRRLAMLHGTHEEAVDDLLRAQVFVDLFTVARQSIAISEDSYSIKRFEKFYGFTRATETKRGDDSILMFERWRLQGDHAILDDIERYNRDDCRSTALLRDWLLARRDEAQATFHLAQPFRALHAIAEATEPVTETAQRGELQEALLHGLPDVPDEPHFQALNGEQRARYLLGHALTYHRREEKPVWWAFFDRCENIDDLLEFDREAIAGLTFLDSVEPRREKQSYVYTYAFPDQRYKLGAEAEVFDPVTRERAGTIVAVDEEHCTLELKRTGDAERARTITALIPGGPPSPNAQRSSLDHLARTLVAGELDREHPAIADLLAARAPRIRGMLPGMEIQPAAVGASSLSQFVSSLDSSYLFVQGPPGSGKTTLSASVICDLLHAGKRVGVVSTGHAAVHNLLHKVEHEMHARGRAFRGLYKHTNGNSRSLFQSRLEAPFVISTGSNDPFSRLDFDLAGGTAWLFARPELRASFDYLFIDEAGQVALADALAIAACAKNVVLLGDPAQLAQVSQGVHPYRAERSVLAHLLSDEPTISRDRGVFLDVTYRMHPEICAFISDSMYESRLRAAAQTSLHRVESEGLSGAGLRYVPLDHRTNASSSLEEAQYVADQIELLLRGMLTDSDGATRAITPRDIIVVTPYNAQRRLIERTLRERKIDVAVGTVDKFQGQEAAVVFYSMATSSGDDVPRDLDFLFEQNRLNVAVSRAKALSVLVCSPRLLDVNCTRVEHIAMVNTLCAYVERATALRPEQDLSGAAGRLRGDERTFRIGEGEHALDG